MLVFEGEIGFFLFLFYQNFLKKMSVYDYNRSTAYERVRTDCVYYSLVNENLPFIAWVTSRDIMLSGYDVGNPSGRARFVLDVDVRFGGLTSGTGNTLVASAISSGLTELHYLVSAEKYKNIVSSLGPTNFPLKDADPIYFYYKTETPDKVHLGLSANRLEREFPEQKVGQFALGELENFDDRAVIAILWSTLAYTQGKVVELEERINALVQAP